MSKNSVIYCRVSTKEQSEIGHSLSAQESECKAFATREGYDVIRVFVEKGESAKTADRTEFQKMIQFITDRKNQTDAVIVKDLDRFSRNPREYYLLTEKLKEQQISILTVAGTNEDSPVGELVRSVAISMAKFENDLKRTRVDAAMREALRKGKFPWKPPVGYKRGPSLHGTGPLVPDEEKAPFIREAFQMLSTGNFTQNDARKMLKKKNFNVSKQQFHKIIHNPLYAGKLRSKYFDKLLAGEHVPLVGWSMYQHVQKITTRPGQAHKRNPRNKDFPLRGSVHCTKCGAKLTGGFSRGKKGIQYGYYRCPNNHCQSISKEKFEAQFLNLLTTFNPGQYDFELFRQILENEWKTFNNESSKEATALLKRIANIQEQRDILLQKMLDGTVDDELYRKMDNELKTELRENGSSVDQWEKTKKNSLECLLDQAEQYFSHLDQLWEAAPYEQRMEMLDILYGNRLDYDGQKFIAPSPSILLRQTATNDDSPREKIRERIQSENGEEKTIRRA